MKLYLLTMKSLLVLALLGLIACSDSGDGKPLEAPGEESAGQSVSRLVKVVTDLISSSEYASIHVLELGNSLKETGAEFLINKTDSIYYMDSITLKNRYALLRTEDMLMPTTMVGTLLPSMELPITLEVLVDLESDMPSYVSLASHFVTARARVLASQGMPADSAILQAEHELYKTFAFESDSLESRSVLQYAFYSDSWLAAVVIAQIFSQFIPSGNFSEQVELFTSEFAEKGTIDSFDAFNAATDVLVDKIYKETVAHTAFYYKERRIVGESVFSRQFYTKLFDLGECTSKKLCEMSELDFENSAYNDSIFICDTLGWVLSSKVSRNTCPYGTVEDYEIRKGAVDSLANFFYHPVLQWKEMDEVEESIGICTPDRYGEYAVIGDSAFYKCGNRLWQTISRDKYNLADIKCDSLPKYYILGRDSVTYYSCTEGVVSSLSPEENSYAANTIGLPCDTTPDLVLGHDSVTYYVCDAQRLREATKLELTAKRGCNFSNYDEDLLIEHSYYRCRGKWNYNQNRIYRDTVTDERDGKDYPLVGMGSQLWFAANLNYETDSSWCYNDSTEYCEEYGRIYRFAEAGSRNKDTQLCPSGFHTPTKEEYEILMAFAEEWVPKSQNMSVTQSLLLDRSNYFGFNAQLAGKRHLNGEYSSFDVDYCTSSDVGTDGYNSWLYDSSQYFKMGTTKDRNYCYLRCIAD